MNWKWIIFSCFTFCMVISSSKSMNAVEFLDKPNCSENGIVLPIMQQINAEIINEMTLCLRFKMKFLKPTILVSWGKLHHVTLFDFNKKNGFISFNNFVWMFLWTDDILPNQWHHFCYSFAKNSIWIILDGKLLHDDMLDLPDINLNLGSGYVLSLGTVKGPSVSSLTNVQNKFIGEMTEVNFWNQGLTIQNMIDTTSKCNGTVNAEPDLFKWSDLDMSGQFTICFVSREVNRKLELCTAEENKKKLILIEESATYQDAKLNCFALGGKLPIRST